MMFLFMHLVKLINFGSPACEAKRHIVVTLFDVCLCVCLSGSHIFAGGTCIPWNVAILVIIYDIFFRRDLQHFIGTALGSDFITKVAENKRRCIHLLFFPRQFIWPVYTDKMQFNA